MPQGGNFDGYAGVVAGLLCLLEQKRGGENYRLPLEVVAFRGEESAWFGKAYTGSGALFGKISAADLELQQRTTGETMADCMRACGADVESRHRLPVVLSTATKSIGIRQTPRIVAMSIPENTAAPITLRASAPAPVAVSSGTTPRMNAN